MAASKSTLAPLQSIVYATSETAILQNAALYQSVSADMTAMLPAGAASTLKPLGFSRYDQTSGQTNIEVITAGECLATAGAAITAGDDLESAGTTGKVQTRTTGSIIARALDSAGADGDVIRVRIIQPT